VRIETGPPFAGSPKPIPICSRNWYYGSCVFGVSGIYGWYVPRSPSEHWASHGNIERTIQAYATGDYNNLNSVSEFIPYYNLMKNFLKGRIYS
jgi:hypothetical protein